MSGGPLDFDILIRDSEFERQITRIENRVMGMSRKVVQETNAIDEQFKRLALAATGLFTFGQLAQLPMQLIRVRGEFQQLEVAYRTLLGNKEKADQLLADSMQLAAKTPFDLRQVGQGAKQLLAYGFGVEKIIPTLTRLGDISAGTGDDLNHLILVYGTLRAQGRAYQRDIQQFTSVGVPLLDALSKTLGVSVDKVNDLVSAGKVGFPEVEKAIFSLTNKGSMFGGLMAEQSKTLTGLTSNLSDAWDRMLNDIGKSNEGILAGGIKLTTGLVENYQPVLDILGTLIATYGIYKAAVITTAIVEQAATVGKNVQVWWALAKSIKSAADAQALFNLTTGLNPYAVAAAALVGLITVIALHRSELSKAEQAQQDINSAREQSNVKIAEEKAKIESLITTINNDKLSRDARNKKLQELIALSPEHLKALTLDSIRTQEGTAAIDGYVDALKRKFEQEQLNKKLTESFEREAEAKAGKNDLSFLDKIKYAAASAGGEGTYDYGKETALAKDQLNKKIIADEKLYQEELKKEQKLLDERAAAAAKAGAVEQKVVSKTIEWYNEAIEAKQKLLDDNKSAAYNAGIRKEIEALEKSRDRLTGKKSKAAKEADKVGPYGSLSYWDNVAKKADEILAKTPSSDTTKIAQQLAIKANAEQQAADIRKSQEIRTFEEEVEEKKKLYGLYTKWVEYAGQESADVQYKNLLSTGRTYVDYLNKQIARLEQKRQDGTLTKKEGENLLTLTTQRDEATGKKTAIEKFAENLELAKEKAGSLSDYLDVLQRQQDDLQGNNTDFGIEARRIVADATVATQRERRQQLQQFLQDAIGSEQQQTATRKRYSDLRAELDRQYADKKSASYIKALAEIDKAEENDLKDVRERAAQATKEFKKLDDVILERGRAGLRKKLSDLKDYLENASEEVRKTQAYASKQKEADDTEEQINKFSLDDVRNFAAVTGDLGETLSQANGELAKMGGLLSGLAANVNLVSVSFDKTAELPDRIAAGAQGLVSLTNMLISSANQRQQADANYYKNALSFEHQYSLAINNRIGLQSKLNGSVLFRDYAGEAKDAFGKLSDANSKYQDSINKLSEGRAKAGQRTVIDGDAIGKGVGAGAATGAAIGSMIVPVVGTAVGAIFGGLVGGIAGLFGGGKREDEFIGLLEQYPDLIQKGADGWADINEGMANALIQSDQVDDSTKQLLQTTIDWKKQIDEAKEAIKSIVSELAGQLGDTLRSALVDAFRNGTDAATEWGEGIAKILENIISQLLFAKLYGAELKKLSDDIVESLSPTGDGDVSDDVGKFFQRTAGYEKAYNSGLAAAQKQGEAYGFKLFQPDGEGAATKGKTNSLSGAITGVSESTAGIIAGQMTAMRISQAETQTTIRQQLLQLTQIEQNTRPLNSTLQSIDNRLERMERDPTRSKGL